MAQTAPRVGRLWVSCVPDLLGVTLALLSSGNLNDLVQHGLRALRETLPTEQDLTTKVSRHLGPPAVGAHRWCH